MKRFLSIYISRRIFNPKLYLEVNIQKTQKYKFLGDTLISCNAHLFSVLNENGIRELGKPP